jgi:4-amino-4-deoxy-L-arabinose transferase-like glycosyltransferase
VKCAGERTLKRLEDKSFFWISLIIFAIGCFHLLTLRDGQSWGGDFAMYLAHAKNIVEGRPYHQTGYIYNPHYPLAPQNYPPIYPLFLAPVYKLFGINFIALKIENLFFFLGSLWLIFLLLKNLLSFTSLIIAILIFGFNPHFWKFRHHILADIPFLFFTLLAFYVLKEIYERRLFKKRFFLSVFLSAFCIYLSYGTKRLGLFFIPVVFLYDILVFKKITKFCFFTFLLFLFFWKIEKVIFDLSGIVENIATSQIPTWLVKVVKTPSRISFSLKHFYRGLNIFWGSYYYLPLLKPLFWGAFGLSVLGYGKRIIKKEIYHFDCFFFLTLFFLIFLWGLPHLRYLFSFLPLFFLYLTEGIKVVGKWRKSERLRGIIGGILIVFTAFFYFNQYAKAEITPEFIKNGVTKKEAQELFEYIRKKTDKDAVFIFGKPRPLALFTNRSASVYWRSSQNLEYSLIWEYFKKINASYFVLNSPLHPLADLPSVRKFLGKYENCFRKVFQNADHQIYQIIKYPQGGEEKR